MIKKFFLFLNGSVNSENINTYFSTTSDIHNYFVSLLTGPLMIDPDRSG